MRDIVYLNGKYVEREHATVSVEDRGYQFADGIYEVVRFHGRRAIRLDDHLDRLAKSAHDLRIQGVHSPAEWREIIERLLDECQIADDDPGVYCLYQQVTRGVSPRVHVFPKTPVAPTSVAYFRAAPVYPEEYRATGVSLSSQPDERWSHCYIKSVCLLPVILAKQAAVDAGAFEALLVRDGVVTEGGSTNVFCVIDGAVHTHPDGGHILGGVTRQMVLQAAREAGVKVVQRPVPVEEFRSADEAFLSSTTLDIMPATALDDQVIGNGAVGPVTKVLVEALAGIIADELAGQPRRTAAP